MAPGVLLEPYMSQGVRVSQRHLLQVGLGPLKMENYQKQSGNDEFQTKNEYHQISSSFGHHALNPFDTEPVAKRAVKLSIMRVVKFMSSPSNDFTS